MTNDGDRRYGVLVQAGGKLIQDRREVGFDGGTTGVKRHVARNIKLEAVIGGLADCHAGAYRGSFHGSFLVLHFLRPDVAAAGTDCTTEHGTLSGASGAARGCTQKCARDGTNSSALCRTLLGFGHVGATGQCGGDQGRAGH